MCACVFQEVINFLENIYRVEKMRYNDTECTNYPKKKNRMYCLKWCFKYNHDHIWLITSYTLTLPLPFRFSPTTSLSKCSSFIHIYKYSTLDYLEPCIYDDKFDVTYNPAILNN